MRFRIPIMTMILVCLFGSAQGKFCFRGQPLPACKSFWLTESGLLYRLDDHGSQYWKNREWHEKFYYTWEVGLMTNRNPGAAWGGTVFLGWDAYLEDVRFGLKGRYRWWLSPKIGLDLSPGILQSSTISGPPIVCLSASLVGEDRIMVTGQVEMVIRDKTNFLDPDASAQLFWYAGLRCGAEAGVAVGIFIPIIALAIVASTFGGGSYYY